MEQSESIIPTNHQDNRVLDFESNGEQSIKIDSSPEKDYTIISRMIDSVREKFDDVFFIQDRVSMKKDADGNNILFPCVKLRTMVQGTVPSTIDNSGEKTENDERVIPGREGWRRGWDELPQLINILRGEMAFVGPRPLIPSGYDLLSPEDQEKWTQFTPGVAGAYAYMSEDNTIVQATRDFLIAFEYYKTRPLNELFHFKLMCILDSLKYALGGGNK